MLYRCRFAWNDLCLIWCLIHLVFYDAIRTSKRPPRACTNAFLVACLDVFGQDGWLCGVQAFTWGQVILSFANIYDDITHLFTKISPGSKNGVSPRRDTTCYWKVVSRLGETPFLCCQGSAREGTKRLQDHLKKAPRRPGDSLKRHQRAFRIVKYEVKCTSLQDDPAMCSYTCVQKRQCSSHFCTCARTLVIPKIATRWPLDTLKEGS